MGWICGRQDNSAGLEIFMWCAHKWYLWCHRKSDPAELAIAVQCVMLWSKPAIHRQFDMYVGSAEGKTTPLDYKNLWQVLIQGIYHVTKFQTQRSWPWQSNVSCSPQMRCILGIWHVWGICWGQDSSAGLEICMWGPHIRYLWCDQFSDPAELALVVPFVLYS